ncbi:MAG TPA: choice-of-anchor Q domain-containing protein [Tepidisphaeraceae bacterium]|nr:choice-of-anchor Q domain-containing protein [Tepidisphaeraceae bacterium]
MVRHIPVAAEALEERIALAIFTVTNTNDTGAGSFRQAIRDANAGGVRADTIVFDAAFFSTPREILVHNFPEQFGSVSGPLTVVGPGSHLLTIRPGNLANPVNYKALDSFAPELTLSGMTVTGGNAAGNGGGIFLAGNSNNTLEDVVFTNNVANNGGAIALSNNATLTLRNCVITGNRARTGGGIYFFDGGSLVMDNCTVSGNTATAATQYDASGGGIYFFGAARPAPLPAGFLDRTLLVRNSTLGNNAAFGGGGAVALDWLSGTFLVRNSTISGNTAGSSGGGVYNVTVNQTATLTFENATVTGNSAGQTAPLPNAKGGGGIARIGSFPGAINVVNSVVSGNTNPATPDILSYPQSPVTVRYSAVGSANGFTLSGASGNNLPFGANLMLGPLANNGGRTLTHLPQAGSPLVDAGSNALVPAELTLDQRGPGFPRFVGQFVDVGAVERGGVAGTAPRVLGVSVRGTVWATDFRNYLQAQGLGDTEFGYAVPGGPAQLDVLPWNNVNQIAIRFDRPVTVSESNLTVTSASGAVYPFSAFVYFSTTRTAMWIVNRLVPNDRVLLDLDAGPGGVNAAGVPLDGEWADGARPFPSGDGAPGGDFQFRINVVPGDANRNGNVSPTDFGSVRSAVGRSTADVGVPPRNYTVFRDVNGSGSVSPTDIGTVRANMGRALPPPPPLALRTDSATATRLLYASS